MSDDGTDDATKGDDTPPDAPPAPAASSRRPRRRDDGGPREQRYPASRLRDDPAILGQSRPVLVGAFTDAGIADDDELTRAEAEDVISSFLTRPVHEEA